MNHFRRIFAAVATLAGAVLAFATAPAAFAMKVPPPGEGSGIAPPPPPVVSSPRVACPAGRSP